LLAEFVGRFERGGTEIEGCAGGESFNECDGALDAEVLPATRGFEDALGDEEETGTGHEGLDGGLEGEMGEEAERHGDVAEDAGAVVVAKDSRLAASVDVGEETEVEVVTAEKGWCEERAAGSLVDGLVDLMGEGGEGVHHIDDFGGEELRDAATEDVLRGGGDGVGGVAGAGDVGEEEDDVGACGYGVEEVAAGAGGEVAGAEIEVF